MRKVILNLALTLDNFIEGPNGEYDWCFADQDYGMTEFFKRTDAVFMGRRSYELVMKTGDAYLDKMKRYVFSTTMADTGRDDTTVINGDLSKNVQKIKNEPGGDIWLFGGASLVSSFLKEQLIDEFALAIHPLLLGSGKRLFAETGVKIPLELTRCETYDSGLVQLFYRLCY